MSVSVLARLLGRADGEPASWSSRCAAAHLAADACRSSSVSYPKPWTIGVFQSEIEMMRRGERYYLVARDGSEVVGYGGLMFVVGDAHVTNIAVRAARISGRASPPGCSPSWRGRPSTAAARR